MYVCVQDITGCFSICVKLYIIVLSRPEVLAWFIVNLLCFIGLFLFNNIMKPFSMAALHNYFEVL